MSGQFFGFSLVGDAWASCPSDRSFLLHGSTHGSDHMARFVDSDERWVHSPIIIPVFLGFPSGDVGLLTPDACRLSLSVGLTRGYHKPQTDIVKRIPVPCYTNGTWCKPAPTKIKGDGVYCVEENDDGSTWKECLRSMPVENSVLSEKKFSPRTSVHCISPESEKEKPEVDEGIVAIRSYSRGNDCLQCHSTGCARPQAFTRVTPPLLGIILHEPLDN